MMMILLLLTGLFSTTSWCIDQPITKHPRVIEVEMMLSREAMIFLQQRIPNGQVYVNVDIDPLRRNAGVKNEQLPYFYSEDEVGDEWDALDTPIVMLLSRIKRATIKVEVPASITDPELADLKEKLYEQLKLIPIRDMITIQRKAAPVKPTADNKDYTLYYFIAGMAGLIFLGLFLSLRFGSKGTVAATGTASAAQGSSSASAPISPRSNNNNNNNNGSKSSGNASGNVNSKINGDINFKDSLRAADMLKEKLNNVVNSPIFPLLSDMLILDELAEKSLSSFGSFVFEMPRKNQQKIFFRGRSDKWFRGYIEASSVDMDCFVAVEKMLRNRNASGSEKWEDLLIQVWRLGAEAPMFLKQISMEDSFTILSYLPKSFSVPTAKKAFPGAWARILGSREHNPIEDETKIEDYFERTLSLKPFFSFKSIDEYKKDLELVNYLRTTSIKDEEEIYESLSSESQVHNIRPPFYSIFKSEPEDFKHLFEQFELYDWAVAAINSPRDYMKRITSELDEKKKYIFSTYLKQLDETQVSLQEQIDLRDEMANKYRQIMVHKKTAVKAGNEETKEDEANENTLRAA